MTLQELMEARGLSVDEVTSLLSEAGVTQRRGNAKGEPYTAGDLRRRTTAQIPRFWQEALGVESEPEAPQKASQRRGEASPSRPKDAPIVVDVGSSKRIAGAYRFAGAMLATGSGSEGVAEVWDDSADRIAELWTQAAAENPWAARFVEVMNAGGAAGDLAAAHIYLAGATLYVLGARIPAGDTIFSKYSRHRVVVKPKPAEPKPEPASNGAGRAEAGEAVGDAAQGAVVDSPG